MPLTSARHPHVRSCVRVLPLSLLLGAAPLAAAQTVIYDTLSITDLGLYNRAFGDCIGTPPDLSGTFDLQLADDFPLETQSIISRVIADYVSTSPAHAPDAVWVQFFADTGGAPSNDMTADFIATGAAITTIDLGALNTPAPYNHGVRYSVDLSGAGIGLAPGAWWVSVQPIAIDHPDWFWTLRQLNHVVGFDNHARNGGTHHQGEFGGFPGILIDAYNDWVALGSIGFLTGTVPMRIEGFPVAGCPADFNGDTQIDFFDYLDFAAAFDAEDPAADFNGDNQIDFFDYLDFAQAFDAGCD